MTLVRVRDRVHAAFTVPQLDLVAGPCCEVHVQVGLKRERFDAVDLAKVGLEEDLALDVLELLSRLGHLLGLL